MYVLLTYCLTLYKFTFIFQYKIYLITLIAVFSILYTMFRQCYQMFPFIQIDKFCYETFPCDKYEEYSPKPKIDITKTDKYRKKYYAQKFLINHTSQMSLVSKMSKKYIKSCLTHIRLVSFLARGRKKKPTPSRRKSLSVPGGGTFVIGFSESSVLATFRMCGGALTFR